MLADAIQRVTKDQGSAYLRVEKLFHSKVIASAEQFVLQPIPNCKGKITQEILDTCLTPGSVSPQEQFDVCYPAPHAFAPSLQFRNQVGLGVHASICNDPYPAIKGERLLFVFGFLGCTQQRVSETDVAVHPDPSIVRTTEGHEVGHSS